MCVSCDGIHIHTSVCIYRCVEERERVGFCECIGWRACTQDMFCSCALTCPRRNVHMCIENFSVAVCWDVGLCFSLSIAAFSNLYFKPDRELGANWSKRARPPRFLTPPGGCCLCLGLPWLATTTTTTHAVSKFESSEREVAHRVLRQQAGRCRCRRRRYTFETPHVTSILRKTLSQCASSQHI